MVEQIRLGGFALEAPLSSGGMGTVWRARHELTDTPVAVKVILGAYARDPVYVDGFEREVRAVAHMEHPRIIRVYDFGFVDSAAERASGGQLGRLSPWLAMELATQGSLTRLRAVDNFATLQAILFDILDALAHSHARGIIHRDLKPGNVLLTDAPGGVHCKLTDFGISHVAGRSMSTREVFASSAGTPWYMAPEQVDSRWRDYGPWTDLYALGCVAYQFASGHTPFVGESAVRVARQQLFDRPAPLVPRFKAPAGFAAWVERLLVKEIPYRFRRAADAAWALHLISPRSGEPIRLEHQPWADLVSGTETTDVHSESRETGVATLTFLSREVNTETRKSMPRFSVPVSLLTFSIPPIPEQWRLHDDDADTSLPGSGLGLYRVRAVPFVGRETERDIIWRELREAVLERKTRVVVIRGEPGSGKSRLATWMSQRAHELGVASLAHAQHSPIGGESHGIGSMFSRYLGCGGLDFERTYLRIRRLITTTASEPPEVISYFAAAMAKFIHPTGEAAGVPAVQFTSADERHQVVRRVAVGLADRRPLLCVLDDVQWGYDALEFALRMLDVDRPILLLLTVRPDQLTSRPLEAETLRQIERHPDVATIELGPLSRDEHGHLIDQMLELEPTLREEVLDRTGGSPLFAAELLGDWVRRHVLRASPRGFRVDATEEIPPDIHALWNRHVDRILAQTADSEASRAAIEVGAALGTSVAEAQWYDACARLGIDVDPNLLDQLSTNGIVERTEGGWAFRYQMLRESIAQAARESGRAVAQHREVAHMLGDDRSPDGHLRRGLHFLAIDDFAAATNPLLIAVEQMVGMGRVRESSAVLHTLHDVMEHVDDPDLRRRVIEAELHSLRQWGSREAIESFIAQNRPVAQASGWQSTLADFAWAEGALASESGEAELGQQRLFDALAHARLSRSKTQLAAIHNTLGFLNVRFNELDEARDHFEAARDQYELAGMAERVSQALVGLAQIGLITGDFEEARAHNDEAIRLCRDRGYRALLASHLSHRGDVASAEGDHVGALRFFGEAADIARLTDNLHVYPIAIVNSGMALMYLGRTREALERLREAHASFTENRFLLFAYYAELGMLWCASPNDPDGWDRLQPALAARATPNMVLRESSEHALAASARWRSVGDMHRAAQSIALARTLLPPGFAQRFEAKISAEITATRRTTEG